MIVTPLRTGLILPNQKTLAQLLDEYVKDLSEGSVLAITSKIVSLCEGRVVPVGTIDKNQLIKQESDYFLPSENHRYGYHFSVVNNTLISSAGIDESNGHGNYILWPKDPQRSANEIREFLKAKFDLTEVGVIITDSMSRVLRRGSTGTCLAHSGFLALKDYRHTKDLFGHELSFSIANLAEGLAAAAVVTMGEGTEQTPLATVTQLPFLKFQDRSPNQDELDELRLTLENDYFEVFINSAPWQKGGRAKD
jgi:F420-0:gamma-glutamyl ligase